MEGIAGNHRFLAYLELVREEGLDENSVRIPAVLIDCDEGFTISIALMENEVRENLTQWEAVRTLIRAFEQRPKAVETVFEVDGSTVEQLRLWEEELDHEAEVKERQRAFQARLTRQWIALINDRLSEHPELRAHFLAQLRNPAWVQARTLEELDPAITRALLDHGIRFETGKTWNEIPASQCLGHRMAFEEVCEAMRHTPDDLSPQPGRTCAGFCRHLRLCPHYTQQFVPDAGGPIVLEANAGDDLTCYPPETLAPNGRGVQGRIVQLIDNIDAYCVAPDVHQPGSCFHRQEAEAAQTAVRSLIEQGLPDFLREQEGLEKFSGVARGARAPHAPQRHVYTLKMIHRGSSL